VVLIPVPGPENSGIGYDDEQTIARDAQRNRRRELEEGVNGIRREERALLFSTAAENGLQ